MSRRIWIIFSLLFFSLMTPSSAGASTPIDVPKKVLLLLSYKHRMPWQQRVTERILAALDASKEIKTDIHIEYTGLNDYNDTAKIEALQKYYRTSYASLNVDILMTIGLPSSNFVLEHGRDLFGETPVC